MTKATNSNYIFPQAGTHSEPVVSDANVNVLLGNEFTIYLFLLFPSQKVSAAG